MICEPGWNFVSDPSKADNFRIWFVWSGEGELVTPDGERVALLPGVAVVMRPKGVYRATQNPANRLGVTFLNFAYLTENKPLPTVWSWASDFMFVDAITRKIAQLHTAELAGIANSAARTAMLLSTLLDELTQSTRQTQVAGVPTSRLDRDVIELANKVLEMPAEYDDVAELAALTFRSHAHFTRTFKRLYGVSPARFIKSTKLLKARSLLQTSSMSIAEISGQLGYSSTQYFTRHYKSYFANTPGEDRQRAQNNDKRKTEEQK